MPFAANIHLPFLKTPTPILKAFYGVTTNAQRGSITVQIVSSLTG